MYRQDVLKRKALQSGYPGDWDELKNARNIVNNALKKAKKYYFTDGLEQAKNNPKKIWKLINEAQGRKCNRTSIQ